LNKAGRALGSQSEGCGLDLRPMLDGSGGKAMPGSIPAPMVHCRKKYSYPNGAHQVLFEAYII